MRIRDTHRILGFVMLLPLLGWVVTGAVFFLKPGYGAAYAMLPVKTYPVGEPLALRPEASWLEVRYLRTILGRHLLVRTAEGWRQADPGTGRPRPLPTEDEVRRLLADAMASDPARYGRIVRMDGATAITDTQARVSLNWNTLSLQQRGPDTDRIDRLYKLHYLQWTGVKRLDMALGAVGLALLAALSGLGAAIGWRGRGLTRRG